MITEIGIVAGEIWQYLDKNGESLLSKIVQDISQPRDIVMMSLGWLSREGHVILKEENQDYRICLRK